MLYLINIFNWLTPVFKKKKKESRFEFMSKLVGAYLVKNEFLESRVH